MYRDPLPIWDAWSKGGPFIGDSRAVGRVTVQPDWKLHAETTNVGNMPTVKRPIRWFERCDTPLPEDEILEIPNVKSISIDRSIDADADTCTITIYNTQMKLNTADQRDAGELGNPGYFTPGYGLNPEERSRWPNHQVNEWVEALTPNTLLRTYQGFGGASTQYEWEQEYIHDWAYPHGDRSGSSGDWHGGLEHRIYLKAWGSKDTPPSFPANAPNHHGHQDAQPDEHFRQEDPWVYHEHPYSQTNRPKLTGNTRHVAVTGDLASDLESGHLMQTGTWLVDRVRAGTDGMIVLECRSMAKLLIEQQLYPPLVPNAIYPLRYARYEWKNETRANTVGSTGPRNITYHTTANLAWHAGGVVHGHRPEHAFDGNPATFWLSTGNSGPTKPYATEWVQGMVNGWIDTVTIHPWAGNYECYVSVWEGDRWVDEHNGAKIPYQPLGVGRYRPTYEPSIPYVARFGVPWETPVTIKLPRAYNITAVRFTFTNLARSPYGRNPYRAGLRNADAFLSTDVQENYQETVKYDGNYRDYADIVKDLLLWSGFWCKENLDPTDAPHIRGRIESTGIYSEDPLPDDLFDKRPVIDPITELKETVGYIFFVDEQGGVNFRSPNWWGRGNYDENGNSTDFIPEIDERVQLTDYSVQWSDENLRSEIIIASADPVESKGMANTVVTRWRPKERSILRGMVKPAMWVNGYFTSKKEQQAMAELIALHGYFKMRQGNITCWANPALQVDDQIRLYERNTGEAYIHYVRGINTTMDLDTGSYTMSLTTHWLGGDHDWWGGGKR